MDSPLAELNAMKTAFEALSALENEERSRAIQWLIGALGVEVGSPTEQMPSTPAAPAPDGVARSAAVGLVADQTPKAFMADKRPQTVVERIACLAYYLTHFRDTPAFKTVDLTALNTEAALPKLTNPTRDANNAMQANGFLASAGHGRKQITSRGEAVVQALPDREAVKQAIIDHPFRRRSRSRAKARASAGDQTSEA